MSCINEKESLELKIITSVSLYLINKLNQKFLLNCQLTIKEIILNWLNKNEKIIILKNMLNKFSSDQERIKISLRLHLIKDILEDLASYANSRFPNSPSKTLNSLSQKYNQKS